MAIKTITAEALSLLISPRDRLEILSAKYDADRRVFEIECADRPVRPLFVLETEAVLTKEQLSEIKVQAEGNLGGAYDVIVLAHGLKGKVIPVALLKAD